MIVQAFLFFGGIESWKWGKRVFRRRQAKKLGGGRARRLSSVVFDSYMGIQPGMEDPRPRRPSVASRSSVGSTTQAESDEERRVAEDEKAGRVV